MTDVSKCDGNTFFHIDTARDLSFAVTCSQQPLASVQTSDSRQVGRNERRNSVARIIKCTGQSENVKATIPRLHSALTEIHLHVAFATHADFSDELSAVALYSISPRQPVSM